MVTRFIPDFIKFRFHGAAKQDSYARLRAAHGSIFSRLLRRVAPQRRGPAILMYHRVTVPAVDPWGLCVSPTHFGEQLDVLARHRRVIPLDDFVEQHIHGTLPEDAVAITFDDGYADVFLEALPLLERHGAAATLFLVTGKLGAEGELWFDEMSRLLLCGTARTDVAVCGDRFRFAAGSSGGTAARRRAHDAIWRVLRDAAPEERAAALAALRTAFSGSAPAPGTMDRMMTEDEVRRLTASGLVRIGGHSVSHPVLPELSPADREDEIASSRTACLGLSAATSRCFAYPYGDLDGPTRDMVERLGFLGAVTTEMRPVRRGDDRFTLPRLHVRDLGGDAFARLLGLQAVRRG
jgi:peptidoglycan/xylan/chitin deacetylase (PgdA/CDA1 family)